ncbi:TRAP transporter large permease [Roseitranquillus sediminis]|uniref:TRAP transporter large permease n=1 Tax=Roseitranquillus sediminis TaxID=2809051 RepID=UPI001D0C1300|nr:TRAP transporter large permease [Roseitranquillus sediminis]MBM9596468.1 TRAP transporter large permease [Roseitranquillus sediminis]
MTILLIFLALVFMILLNVPIAVALAICGVLGILSYEGTNALVSIGLDMYSGATSFSLIAIPMFVLAGAIMNAAGITRRLIEFVSALIGFVRGGLAMVNVGVSLFFAEISGSAVADVAAMGSVMIPEMKRRGYTAPFAAAVTSSSASLAIIIPPSIPMILYGVSSGASIEQLFLAGLVPGLIGAAGLMALCWYFAKRYDLPREAAFNMPRLKRTFVSALPTFVLPIVILGGIFGGFFTATEAAGVAVIASIIVGLWYHETDFPELKRSMLDGAIQTAVVMLLVAASVLMGGFLTRAQIPQELATALLDFTDSRWAILAILNVFFLVIGFFLHSAAAIILVVPIVVPLISAVGIDPVHFGLIVTLNLAIGQQTPPVASVLITACSIARANIWDVSKANIGFVAVLLFVLMLCTYVEPIPMFLVEVVYR